MAKAKTVTKKPLAAYLQQAPKPAPMTVRAPEELWQRITELANKKQASVNATIVAALQKVCEEEGV